ncbi:Cys-tRNA(Pro) deacylase [Aminobacter sp. SR38]|jgi:Cys-tRNA(Pro)/Cys-tRNA(Cys) deacylase|uniref:aminoacyl-tRNA deacylase n=1 Tax=Aminobacter sp. SR38 TaxID=2774562 RepID=UPI0017857F14|nr:YbaK/EbsC family protein [Aminobacter sp. SR38]QOF74159.1 Cys-tRNA(Pro) deacylase [Aminobacter sp. SR38]
MRAGVSFSLVTYEYAHTVRNKGLYAAKALGVSYSRVLKTLIVSVDAKPRCLVVPSNQRVSIDRVMSALGGTTAEIMSPTEAERVTGYRIGGISPIGLNEQIQTLIEANIMPGKKVFVNAGTRGLLICIRAEDLIRFLGARTLHIVT